MSVLSYIVDALRRIGSSTEKSALRRQDEQLKGLTVLDRGRRVARLEDQTASAFHAVVEPVPEQVSVLGEGELTSIRRNAAEAETIFGAFGVPAEKELLDRLDHAFQLWLCAADRRGFSEIDVVEILGAQFGEYCNSQLGMEWIKVSDQFGDALAIEGIDSCFRAFPYNSVEKRIADGEHTFFRGIFIHLADQKQCAKRRGDAT